MSFDLEIVTNLKPESSHVDEFFFSRKSFVAEGKLGGEAGNVLTRRYRVTVLTVLPLSSVRRAVASLTTFIVSSFTT